MSAADGATTAAGNGATGAADGAYRRLLRVYPRTWRAEHGDAYLGVMLDVADAEGRTGPVAAERVSAYRHAATVWRAELGRRGAGDPALASLRWAGPVGLVGGAVLAVLALAFGEAPLAAAGPGCSQTWMTVLAPGWLAALVAALAGRRTAARAVCAALAVLPAGATLLGLARLGGATTGDGTVIRLFPGYASFVGRVVPAGLLDRLAGTRPPLGVVALSVLCAAAVVLAGPPATALSRRRTAVAVAGATAFATVCLLWLPGPGAASGVSGWIGWAFYREGLGRLAAVVLLGVAAATVAGLGLLARRPGVLLAVTAVGWPWALAVTLAQNGVLAVTGGYFPWSATAFAVLLAPGATGVGLTVAVTAIRLRGRQGRAA